LRRWEDEKVGKKQDWGWGEGEVRKVEVGVGVGVRKGGKGMKLQS
jgi:hypothetical protein